MKGRAGTGLALGLLLVGTSVNSAAPPSLADDARVPAEQYDRPASEPAPCTIERFEKITIAGATDCGRTKSGEPTATVDACVSRALRARYAFRARYDAHGIDSLFSYFIYRERGGPIEMLTYDSAPCGRPGCPSIVFRSTCTSARLRPPRERTHSVPHPVECHHVLDSKKICPGASPDEMRGAWKALDGKCRNSSDCGYDLCVRGRCTVVDAI